MQKLHGRVGVAVGVDTVALCDSSLFCATLRQSVPGIEVSTCRVAMGVQAVGFAINRQVVKSIAVSSLGVTVRHADTRGCTSCKCCTIEDSSGCHAAGILVA